MSEDSELCTAKKVELTHCSGVSSSQYYFIKSHQNGLVLDVEYSVTLPGTLVSPWEKNGTDAQKWCDDPATGTIRTKLNGYCMDIESSRLVINPYKVGRINQQWERDGKMIVNRSERNIVIDMEQPKQRSRVYPHPAHCRSNQCWTFEMA